MKKIDNPPKGFKEGAYHIALDEKEEEATPNRTQNRKSEFWREKNSLFWILLREEMVQQRERKEIILKVQRFCFYFVKEKRKWWRDTWLCCGDPIGLEV